MNKQRLKQVAEVVQDLLNDRKIGERRAEAQELDRLARKILNGPGMERIETHLAFDEVEDARTYIFSGIHLRYELGTLSDNGARRYYHVLGIPPEQAAAMHQFCADEAMQHRMDKYVEEKTEKHRRFDPLRKIH